MWKTAIAILLAAVVSGSVSVLAAEPCGTTNSPQLTAPPARPAALTAGQYAALENLQTAPEHQQVQSISATYSAREESLQFTRFSDDAWTVIYDVGWPGSYLAVLLCAL